MTAYLLLFAAAFASATLAPGFSEAGVAAMVADGFSLVAVIAVASAGNTLGSAVNWWLGRFALRYADRRWFPVSPQSLVRAEGWFKRYGCWSLLLAWLPIVGDPLTLLAGTLRVPFGLFILLVGIGKTLRYVVVATVSEQALRAFMGG